VGGTGVLVGGTDVFVGGTSVFVGGTGVLVGGTDVFVGGTGVFVGAAAVGTGAFGLQPWVPLRGLPEDSLGWEQSCSLGGFLAMTAVSAEPSQALAGFSAGEQPPGAAVVLEKKLPALKMRTAIAASRPAISKRLRILTPRKWRSK
jgi:hypothetical protein